MRKPITIATLIAITGLLAGCNSSGERGAQKASPAAKLAATAPITWPCALGVPTVTSTIPNDAPLTDQPTMNCFAWQEFIALNWAAEAGQRGVADPNVPASQFGNPPPPPVCNNNGSAVALASKPGTRVLGMTSAFGDFTLDQSAEASGQWLADQSGNLIWYEVKMNLDEFQTIVSNQFYNATVQQTTASTGKNPTPGGAYQVKLPAGCLPGSCPNNGSPVTGAIELKAAWRILTNPTTQSSRYLTSQAVILNNGSCSTVTVGLVGLHIIHKTVTQPQFIWATFEQVDNLPPASPATFASNTCTCQTAIPTACIAKPQSTPLYQNCLSTQTQGQTCTPNTPPPYNTISAGCQPYPIQVSRNRPISNNSTDPVVATNTAAVQLITNSNANSVFQYYQLIDVLWSGSPQDSYTNSPGQPGPKSPLSMSGATPDPSALPVSNVTLETYVQNLTCLTCHVNAKISDGTYASDYSFLIGEAQSPGAMTAAVRSRRQRTLPPGLVKFKH
jgi:hypothetical protein